MVRIKSEQKRFNEYFKVLRIMLVCCLAFFVNFIEYLQIAQ